MTRDEALDAAVRAWAAAEESEAAELPLAV